MKKITVMRHLQKKSNRKESLSLALEPLKNQINDDTVHKLVMLLSVLYGTEAMVVLKDTFHLENDEIINLTTWAAKLIIRQAIIEDEKLSMDNFPHT
ncbi:hypothetical protein [Xenorhabdus nematophila]|uniref:hypothetical protein n=1 Tax=Xenorhabdus nematophila TaxID=628 RepID=UPI000AF31262|nr:hypothetical protein [Xenorhabdus nematophila]